MQKMTTKAYAIKNKLSLFQVIKKVKSGELKSEVIEANGKEITYILADESSNTESSKKIPSTQTLSNIEQELASLKKEVEVLRNEITLLRKKL